MEPQQTASDEFRPMLNLASDVLQDTISLAGLQDAGTVRIRQSVETITEKMIKMMSLLSKASLEYSRKTKEFEKQERRWMKYIENLRNCVEQQNEEIIRLKSIQDVPATIMVDNSTNTDPLTFEMNIMKKNFESDTEQLRSEVKKLQLKCSKLERDCRQSLKELAKANLILETQQLLLDDSSDKIKIADKRIRKDSDDGFNKIHSQHKKSSSANSNSNDDYHSQQMIGSVRKMRISTDNRYRNIHSEFDHSMDNVSTAMRDLSKVQRNHQRDRNDYDNKHLPATQEHRTSRYSSYMDDDEQEPLQEGRYENETTKRQDDDPTQFENPVLSLSTESNGDHESNQSTDSHNIETSNTSEDRMGMYSSPVSNPVDSSNLISPHTPNDSFELIAGYYDDYFQRSGNNNEVHTDASLDDSFEHSFSPT